MQNTPRVVHTPISDMADAHVAARIRERRKALGLSLQQFADMIGVVFEQANKYEKGRNRIMIGRLHAIARALDVPVGYFYEGLPGADPAQGLSDDPAVARLIRNVRGIENPEHQEGFCRAVRLIAPEAARTSASDANQ